MPGTAGEEPHLRVRTAAQQQLPCSHIPLQRRQRRIGGARAPQRQIARQVEAGDAALHGEHGLLGQRRGGGAEAQRAALDAPAVRAAREGKLRTQPLTERHAQLRAGVPARQLQVQRHRGLRRLRKRLRQAAGDPDQGGVRVQGPAPRGALAARRDAQLRSPLGSSGQRRLGLAATDRQQRLAGIEQAARRDRKTRPRPARAVRRPPGSPVRRATGPVRLERCRRSLAKASVPCCTWIGGTPATGDSCVPSSTAVTRTRGGSVRCAASFTSTSSRVAPESSMPGSARGIAAQVRAIAQPLHRLLRLPGSAGRRSARRPAAADPTAAAPC